MKYLRQVYYWASKGSPDAVPAGIICIGLGFNEANFNDEEMSEIRLNLSSHGMFDDTGWQLGFSMDDIDLVRGEDGKYASFLTTDIIVADWQWELIKKQDGLRIAEIDFLEYIAEMERWCEEEDVD